MSGSLGRVKRMVVDWVCYGQSMLFVLLATALASNGGGAWPEGSARPKASQCAIDDLERSRSVLGLRVRKVELDQAEKTLGPAPRWTKGDGGEWRSWRCWESANGDGTVLQVGRTDVDAFIRSTDAR